MVPVEVPLELVQEGTTKQQSGEGDREEVGGERGREGEKGRNGSKLTHMLAHNLLYESAFTRVHT